MRLLRRWKFYCYHDKSAYSIFSLLVEVIVRVLNNLAMTHHVYLLLDRYDENEPYLQLRS